MSRVILLDERLHFVTIDTAKIHIRTDESVFAECGTWIAAATSMIGREQRSGDVCKNCVRSVKVASKGSDVLRIEEREATR